MALTRGLMLDGTAAVLMTGPQACRGRLLVVGGKGAETAIHEAFRL